MGSFSLSGSTVLSSSSLLISLLQGMACVLTLSSPGVVMMTPSSVSRSPFM